VQTVSWATPPPSAASVTSIPVLEHDLCGKIKQMPTNNLKNALLTADIPMGPGKEEQDLLFILRNRAITHP
jgi:hypothetical protein